MSSNETNNTEKTKIYKGDFGYMKYRKKVEIAKTLFLLALSVILYVAGYIATGSNQNLLTFAAVLGCLPMARSAVEAVLFIKAGECLSEETYRKIEAENLDITYYDLYYTSYKKNFPVAAIKLKKGSLIALSLSDKVEASDFEEHIKGILANCGGSNIAVKLFKDTDKFIERARELNALSGDDPDYSFILENILSTAL